MFVANQSDQNGSGALSAGKWLCLFTQPNREGMASSSLRSAGFDVYAPLCRKLVVRRGKKLQVSVPMFSRYVFADIDRNPAAVFGAHRLNGVTSFAGRTLEQSFVDGAVIRAIMEREDGGVVNLDASRLRPGQAVRVIEGAFAGLDAIFAESDDRRRCFILLSLLGKTHRVAMPLSALAPAA